MTQHASRAVLGRRLRPRYAAGIPVGSLWLGVILQSSGPVLIRASASSATAFAFWRLLTALPLLAILTPALDLHALARARATRAGLAVSVAGLSLGLNQLLTMQALRTVAVAEVTAIGAASPVVAGALARLALGTRRPRAFWLWAAVASTGTVGLVLQGGLDPGGQFTGRLLALGGVFAFAAFLVASAVAREEFSSSVIIMGVTLVATLLVATFAAGSRTSVELATSRDVWLVIGVAVGGGTYGHLLFTYGLRWLDPSLGSVVRLMHPVFAGALAWLFLGELWDTHDLVAGIVILAGVLGCLRVSRLQTARSLHVSATAGRHAE